ncbi:MAG: ABC transporter permease [Candidatus Bipolaricaulia bacterium]
MASIAIFAVVNVIPGDPAQVILGTQATPETLERVRERLGLDQPLHVRYLNWIQGIVFRGDFGESITYDLPITQLIVSRLAVTGPLALMAMLVAVVIALPLGIYAGTHRRRIGDYGAMIFAQLGMAIPAFWLGILLIYGLAVNLNLFPAGGFTRWSENPLLSLKSLVLPAASLGVIRAAIITRMTRSSVLEVLQEDYVRTARSKGLRERVVIYKHVLRNAMISVVTITGLEFGRLIANAIIIESVFYLPGMGRLVLQSISQRDLPVIQGMVLFIAAAIMIINFVVDLLYGLFDPRIRYD